MSINQIFEGWKNELFPNADIKDIIEALSAKRMEHCNTCEWHSKNHKTIRIDAHCVKCGCTLSAKTKCPSCKCPLNPPKWGPENIVKMRKV